MGIRMTRATMDFRGGAVVAQGGADFPGATLLRHGATPILIRKDQGWCGGAIARGERRGKRGGAKWLA